MRFIAIVLRVFFLISSFVLCSCETFSNQDSAWSHALSEQDVPSSEQLAERYKTALGLSLNEKQTENLTHAKINAFSQRTPIRFVVYFAGADPKILDYYTVSPEDQKKFTAFTLEGLNPNLSKQEQYNLITRNLLLWRFFSPRPDKANLNLPSYLANAALSQGISGGGYDHPPENWPRQHWMMASRELNTVGEVVAIVRQWAALGLEGEFSFELLTQLPDNPATLRGLVFFVQLANQYLRTCALGSQIPGTYKGLLSDIRDRFLLHSFFLQEVYPPFATDSENYIISNAPDLPATTLETNPEEDTSIQMHWFTNRTVTFVKIDHSEDTVSIIKNEKPFPTPIRLSQLNKTTLKQLSLVISGTSTRADAQFVPEKQDWQYACMNLDWKLYFLLHAAQFMADSQLPVNLSGTQMPNPILSMAQPLQHGFQLEPNENVLTAFKSTNVDDLFFGAAQAAVQSPYSQTELLLSLIALAPDQILGVAAFLFSGVMNPSATSPELRSFANALVAQWQIPLLSPNIWAPERLVPPIPEDKKDVLVEARLHYIEAVQQALTAYEENVGKQLCITTATLPAESSHTLEQLANAISGAYGHWVRETKLAEYF